MDGQNYDSQDRASIAASRGKTAKRVEMPFGLRIYVGPRNHVLDVGSDPSMGKDNFKGGSVSILCCELCKNSWTGGDTVWDLVSAGPKNHVLDGVPDRPMQRRNF